MISLNITGSSLPDWFAGAGEVEPGPFFRHGTDDVVAHADFTAPFALDFRRPFVGRVEPDL